MNGVLLALVRAVLGRGRLRRMARRLLRAAPRVQARVQLWMYRAAQPARAQLVCAQLSPRARRLHRQLKRARGC